MMPYNDSTDARRRNLKLALDSVSLSMLFFVSGAVLTTLKDAILPFTDIHIPTPIFGVLSIFYFVFFIVFSFALLIPAITEVVDELLSWIASSILWYALAALIFFPILALTFIGLIQSTLAFPVSIFSLPVMSIVAGWLVYVAVIVVIDLIQPEWRESLWSLVGGANREMNYSEQIRETRAVSHPAERASRPLAERAVSPPSEPGNFAGREPEERAMARENYLDSGGGHGINWAFLLTGVFTVLVSGAFGYYYWQTTNTINQRNLTIATQNATIAQRDSQIAALQTDLATEKANSTSLQTQLTATQGLLTAANTQIASLQSALTTEKANSTSIKTQLATAQSQASALQTQVDSMTAIVNLTASTVQASSLPVSQTFGALSTVTSFTANYAGYILITGSSSSANGYLRVTESYSSYPFNSYNIPFGTGTSVVVPVLPGSITVSFGNTDLAGTVTATINVTYYY